MNDRSLFELDPDGRWRLAYDRQQWVVQRKVGPSRPANRSGIADSGWRGVSFIGSEKRVLRRCVREAGVVLTAEAQAMLDALPARFLDLAQNDVQNAVRRVTRRAA